MQECSEIGELNGAMGFILSIYLSIVAELFDSLGPSSRLVSNWCSTRQNRYTSTRYPERILCSGWILQLSHNLQGLAREPSSK